MPMPTVFCEFCGNAVFVQNPRRYILWVHEVAKNVVRCGRHKRSSLDHYKCRTHRPDNGEVIDERLGRDDILYWVHELHCAYQDGGKDAPGFNEILDMLLGYYGAWREQHGIGSK